MQVVPAWAGVIPAAFAADAATNCSPRVGGGDPVKLIDKVRKSV